MLAVSGKLNPKMFGPSIYPTIPPEVHAGQSVPGAGWEKSPLEEQVRRSIYIHSQRRLLYPQLMTFDQPDTTQSCPRRERSNTPLQALNSLNDPVLLECAVGLADRVLEHTAASFTERLNYAFRLALSRLPSTIIGPSYATAESRSFETRISPFPSFA